MVVCLGLLMSVACVARHELCTGCGRFVSKLIKETLGSERGQVGNADPLTKPTRVASHI